MTADLETLVVAAYYIAGLLPTPRTLGRPPETTDEELIALTGVARARMRAYGERREGYLHPRETSRPAEGLGA
jgi:hypothetical protein